jgi:hypothetical protein
MSYMSLLEIKARNAYAVNILNKLRHRLLGRSNKFGQEEADVLLDSLELNENPELSSKLIQYSLYGLGDYRKSSALELSEILRSTSQNLSGGQHWKSDYVMNLKNYLKEKRYESSEQYDEQPAAKEILKFINSAIDNIYNSTLSKAEKPKEFGSL